MISSQTRLKGIIGLNKARMYKTERLASGAVDDCLEVIGAELDQYVKSLEKQIPSIVREFVRTKNFQYIQDFLGRAFTAESVESLGRRITDKINIRLKRYGFSDGLKTVVPAVASNDQWLAGYCSEAASTLRISTLVLEANKAAWSGALGQMAQTLDSGAALILDIEERLLSAFGFDVKIEQQRLADSISTRLAGLLENGRHGINRELSRQVIEEIYSQYEDREKMLKKRIQRAYLALDATASQAQRMAS
ncbi:MAG: hypothetical protein HPY50_08870 [Firmicutes bacterium]|nr:hypothetical protein [Bacillota bacterium]